MKITTSHEHKSVAGPEQTFSGAVRIDGFTMAEAPATFSAAQVTFEPGARTAWHTHPLGQMLIVTFGEGWVQVQGQPRQTIRAGDTVWFAPGERHWHGATDQKAMTHIAIQQAQDGVSVDWQDLVADADYAGSTA